MGIWSGIKYALNSTLGTSDFKPLNTLLQEHANWNMNNMMARLIGKDTWSGQALDTRIARMIYQPYIEDYAPGWHYLKIPYGVVSISISASAGGGGGGGGSASLGGGGGGGGAWVDNMTIQINPNAWNTMVRYHVGGGGAGGGDSADGSDGSPTIFEGYFTLPAGGGGKAGVNGGAGGAAGDASAGKGGSYGTKGGNSAKGSGGTWGCNAVYCGGGGGASWGAGGSGQSDTGTDTKSSPIYGGGGGGASRNNYQHTGRNGANGFIQIRFNW